MNTISLTFEFASEETAALAVQELSDFYGYAPTVASDKPDGEPMENPESREAFAKRMLGLELRERLIVRVRNRMMAQVEEQLRKQLAETIVR